MAYKVYAGTVKLYSASHKTLITDDDITWYQAQDEWITKDLVYPSEDCTMQDMKLTCSNKEVGTFEFTLRKQLYDAGADDRERTDTLYDTIDIYRTHIAIEEDGKTIWMGTVTEIELEFDLSKKVVCRDPLYLLNMQDRLIDVKDAYPIKDIFNNCATVSTINTDGANPTLHAIAGNLTVHPDDTINTSETGAQIGTAWSLLQTNLFDKYDGYLRLRYLNAGECFTIVVDYLSDIDQQTEQCVKYGENMLDLTITNAIDTDVRNGAEAYGDSTSSSGWWIWKKTTTQRFSYNMHNVIHEYLYGFRNRLIASDKASTENGLRDVAKAAYDETFKAPAPVVTVKAFDLCDTTRVYTDHLGFLKKTRIVSEPHGIDEWMVCTKAVLPLDRPDQKEFTFGRPPEKLTSQQNRNTAASEQASLSLKGLISYTQSKQG